uniref:Uncharacterized protein n=1 Tax=Parastrongyloides trichosuri TaxID=131310 RepID=A0A0N4ZH55_PARTI
MKNEAFLFNIFGNNACSCIPLSLFHCPCQHQQSQAPQISYVDRPVYIPSPAVPPPPPAPVPFYSQPTEMFNGPMNYNNNPNYYVQPPVFTNVESHFPPSSLIPDVPTETLHKEDEIKITKVEKATEDINKPDIVEKKTEVITTKKTSIIPEDNKENENIIVNVVGGQHPTEVLDTTHLNTNINDEQLAAEDFDHNLQSKVVKVHKKQEFVNGDEDLELTNDRTHTRSNIFNEQIEGSNFRDSKNRNVIVKKVITKTIKNGKEREVVTRFGNGNGKKRIITKIVQVSAPGSRGSVINSRKNRINNRNFFNSNGALIKESDNNNNDENDYIENIDDGEEESFKVVNSINKEEDINVDEEERGDDMVVKNNKGERFQLVPIIDDTDDMITKKMKPMKLKKNRKPFVEIAAATIATEGVTNKTVTSEIKGRTTVRNDILVRTTITTTPRTSINRRKFQKAIPRKPLSSTVSPVKNDNTIEGTINDEEYDTGPEGPETIKEETIEYIETNNKDMGSSPAPPDFALMSSTPNYEIENNRVAIDHASIYEAESMGLSTTGRPRYGNRRKVYYGVKNNLNEDI